MKSLGFVEVSGVVAAVDALDIMCKTANVSLVTWERKLGGRLVTIIIEGSVSDVTQAIQTAKEKCISRVRAANVIANPHSETIKLVELSRSRIEKNKKIEKSVESEPKQAPAAKPAAKRTTAKKTKQDT